MRQGPINGLHVAHPRLGTTGVMPLTLASSVLYANAAKAGGGDVTKADLDAAIERITQLEKKLQALEARPNGRRPVA